ncbi:MAG: sulfotransferase [Hydrococcus sp. Prado102]|jgi:hypothetical protein|nr:sulfotransferase [Hydrococcus sp. Prado102]
MGILNGNVLLKQKAFQKELSHRWRYQFDLKYRRFWDDCDRLENLLAEPVQIEQDIDPKKLKDWTPIELHLSKKDRAVAWLDLGKTCFSDKMSAYTVCRSWQDRDKPQPIWTKVDVLTKLQSISPGLKPKGFIFNVSKCGSTLLAKMLSSIPKNLVISEDTVINKCLMPNDLMAEADGFPDAYKMELFRSIISALGQPRLGVEENYIIRFSPKNVLELPFIKQIYPDVPWIFLYRDPVEVVVSDLVDRDSYKDISELVRQVLNLSAINLTKISPQHTHLAKQILDFSASEIARMSDEEFLARRNGIYSQMPVHFFDKNALLMNYNQLLSASGLYQVLDRFQIKASDAEIATMLESLQNYSKDNLRQHAYQDDRADKQKMASKKLRNLVEQWAMEPYIKLEEMRQHASSIAPIF